MSSPDRIQRIGLAAVLFLGVGIATALTVSTVGYFSAGDNMARGRKPAVVMGADTVGLAHKEGRGAGGAVALDEPPGMTAAVREKWRKLVPLIAKACPLKETDADALRQYCEAVTLREKAQKEMETAPLVLVTPNGAQQVNPLLKIVSQCEAVMMKLSERFGLDPASRKRLAIEASNPSQDEMSDFIASGRTEKGGK